MKLLLDQGLPRSAAAKLGETGIDVVHTADVGLASAADAEILDWARTMYRTIVTLDSDFHAILALSGARAPSVIRIRIESLDAAGVAALVRTVVTECEKAIEAGSAITVTERAIRLRTLPILRDTPY